MTNTATPDNIPIDSFQPGDVRQDESLRQRPRLLFLARPFPPARRSSCTRTWNIAKYLARFGWDVTVVTPHPSVWRQIDDPEEVELKLKREGIKRILSDHRWRCLQAHLLNCQNKGLGGLVGGMSRVIARRLGIDNGAGWRIAAEQACANLSSGDVDLILATALPVSAFRLAKKLSDRLGCPYVMDYRDPWTQNPHRAGRPFEKPVQEESYLLAGSAAVTIVSPSWGEVLDRQHGVSSKLHVITNGYDPEDLSLVEPVEFGHFAIVYAGVLYPPKRVITPVMQAIRRLKQNLNGRAGEFYFHYYGAHQEHVLEEAERAGVSGHVVLHGEVSRAEALSAVKGANLAVVITTVLDEASKQEQGIVTGKIFDAVGLGVPILLICPPGSDAEIVAKDTGLGKAFRGTDVDGIAAYMWELMSGRAGHSDNIAEYSWANIANRLDHILRRVLENKLNDAKTLRVATDAS
jgi:glycosyltransferase involved in cell wall biosynthesis